jgi:REP element-mobilizing transposase RayT
MRAIKDIRLKNYDYKSNGYYFVTICTNCKQPYLQDNDIKNVVVAELARLNHLEGIKVDYSVIMPTHIHVIIVLEETKYSLFEVVKRFKSKTIVFIKKYANQGWQLHKFWQPGYYEHVIRNEGALARIREYIRDNPNIARIKFEQFYCSNPIHPSKRKPHNEATTMAKLQ